MTKLRLTDGFLDDLAAAPERIEEAVWEKLTLVQAMPGAGSSLLSQTLRKRFGANCLKLLVFECEILYRHDEQNDAVDVLALVHQRAVR